MNLQEFINEHTGKYLEVAGSANAQNQCVDLANAYIRDVLVLPIIEWTNAVDFPSKGGDLYDFIPNTPDGFPIAGDLIIFGPYKGLYGTPGHIGVVVYADVKLVKVFEENYPTGSVCKIGDHNYLGCKGWMRAKPRISSYGSVFEKYGYPATLPAESLEIIFSKYHEWRDKLQQGQLLTKEESDQKLKEADSALSVAKISLQRNELYRAQLAKSILSDESGSWDKILESVPAIIKEAGDDEKPAKAAHELFVKVNELYHGVYVYPEDISTALNAFYGQFLEYKTANDQAVAKQVADNKDQVINVTPQQAESFITKLVQLWSSIWKTKT